jgi:hypothetical protein
MNTQLQVRLFGEQLSQHKKPFVCLLLAMVSVSFSGCSVRGLGTYRLEKIGEEMAVIPPPYANLKPGETVRFNLQAGKGPSAGVRNNCSAASGPFKLSGTPQGWKATLPSLRRWTRETEQGDFHQHFETFVRQISTLADKGCISGSDGLMMERGLREAVPMAARDTTLYRYGYSAGEGVINLEPGMRLVIQRAEYNGDHKFLGTEIVYYNVARDSKGGLRIRSGRTERRGRARILPGDIDLGKQVRGADYVRLFFSGNLVPHNLNYSALVVGTRTLQDMEAIARGLQAHPQNGCPALGNGVHCKPYFGMVTVVAELGVKVNGRRIFVAPGDNVRDALEKAGREPCLKNLHELRIERQFLGQPIKLQFAPLANAILSMELVANDRISCSPDNAN